MKSLIISMAIICVGYCWGSTPVSLGPFLFTIPVVGISEDSLPALEDAFHEVLGERGFLEPGVKDGELHFWGGGGGPKALLTLKKVTTAVNQAGFKVDRSLWRLKSQMLGISLSSIDCQLASDVSACWSNRSQNSVLHKFLDKVCLIIFSAKQTRNIRWSIDVDPIDLT